MSDVDLISGLHSIARGMDIPDLVVDAMRRIRELQADLDAVRASARSMDIENTALAEKLVAVRADMERLREGLKRQSDYVCELLKDLAAARARNERLRDAARLFHCYVDTNWQSVEELMTAAEESRAALRDIFGMPTPNIDATPATKGGQGG